MGRSLRSKMMAVAGAAATLTLVAMSLGLSSASASGTPSSDPSFVGGGGGQTSNPTLPPTSGGGGGGGVPEGTHVVSDTAWVKQASPVGDSVLGMSAVSSDVAWGVTYGGTVLRTVDGGTTWATTQTPCSWYALPDCVGYEYLWDIVATSAEDAWAVGSFGAVIHTIDGGASWATLKSGGDVDDLKHIARAPDGSLWVAGRAGVYRSTDEGATWTGGRPSPDAEIVNDIVPISGAEAWAVGNGTQMHVWHTTDGGATWPAAWDYPAAPTGDPKELLAIAISPQGRLWAVGTLCAADTDPYCHTIQTLSDDGGSTWSISPVAGDTLTSIVAVSNTTAWAAGIPGAVRKTTDGGQTWLAQMPGITDIFWSLVAPSPSQLWASGGGGAIARGDLLTAGATPTGSQVLVLPASSDSTTPVDLTFENVAAAGTTTVTVTDTAPALPTGYQIGDPPTYLELQTTALYEGAIQVCLSYAGVTPAPNRLLHFVDGSWQDITSFIDPVDQTICGETTSLSPFAAARVFDPPTVQVPAGVTALAANASGAAVTYAVSAVDGLGASLEASCSVPSGSTFPIGTSTVTCVATDFLGQIGSANFDVVVGYGLAAFAQPLNDPITASSLMSVFKAGSTVSLKFTLAYADGSRISDGDALGIVNACSATVAVDQSSSGAPSVDEVASTTSASAGSCFRYDSAAHQFVFNLGTKGLTHPASYLLTAQVAAPDGTLVTSHSVPFGLR